MGHRNVRPCRLTIVEDRLHRRVGALHRGLCGERRGGTQGVVHVMVPGSALDVLALPLLSTNAMHIHEAALTIVSRRRGFVLLMGIVSPSPVRGRISTGAPTPTPTPTAIKGPPAKFSSISSVVSTSSDSTVTMGPTPTSTPATTPAPTTIPSTFSFIPPFSGPVHLFNSHVLLSVVPATPTPTSTSAPPVIVVVTASSPRCVFNSVIQIRWAQAHISLTFIDSLV